MPRYVLPGRQGRKGNYRLRHCKAEREGSYLRPCLFLFGGAGYGEKFFKSQPRPNVTVPPQFTDILCPSGRSCRTVRYNPAVANRTWFLFSVSSFKVDNPAAARREATPPHFCLSERQPKHYGLPLFYVEPKFSAFSFGELKVNNTYLPAPRRLRAVGLISRCHRSFTVVRSAFGRRQATCGYFTVVPHPAVRHIYEGAGFLLRSRAPSLLCYKYWLLWLMPSLANIPCR